jgi:prepilin-type N-terminal cleavage/methylation domain-containing protein
MNKKGMTLIELLVYMAIAALLLAPVIMLMQNSSVNMARDAVNTDLRISGRDILNIMYEDIRNTGFKLKTPNGDTCTGVTFIEFNTAVPPVMTKNDPSSIQSGDGTGTSEAFDTLTIRKGKLDKNTGEWGGYDEIKYYVHQSTTDSTLIWEHTKSYDKNGIQPSTFVPVKREIAKNVEALQFQYSDSLSTWVDGNNSNSLFVGTGSEQMAKDSVKYIKIAVVTVDKKKLAPTKTFLETPVPVYTGSYTHGPFDDQYLREVSEIVVPIPNNGLFPQ